MSTKSQFTYRVPANASPEFGEYIESQIEAYGSFPKFVTKLIKAAMAGESKPAPAATQVPAPSVAAPVVPQPASVEIDEDALANAISKQVSSRLAEKFEDGFTSKQLAVEINKALCDKLPEVVMSRISEQLEEPFKAENVELGSVIKDTFGAYADKFALENNAYMEALVNRIDIALDYIENLPAAAAASSTQVESEPVEPAIPAPVVDKPVVPASSIDFTEPKDIFATPEPVGIAPDFVKDNEGTPVPYVIASAEALPGDDELVISAGEIAEMADDEELVSGALLLLADD